MKKTLHFQLLFITALIFCLFFSAEKIQASGSDVSRDIFKLTSIDGVDISVLGISEEMMTVTLFPDGTGTLNWEGMSADFKFRELDQNNISINIEGDELPGTLNGDTLSLSIDGADFVLVKDPPEIVEEDKPPALSNLFGTLWSALIGEKKEQEPAPTPTEIPQPTAVPAVEPTKESIPSGFKDKLADLTNTVRESQPVEQEEQIISDESHSTEENNSSGSKDKWAELANAVRESQNSEQNEQHTAVVSQPTATLTTVPTDQPKTPSPTPRGLLPASFKVGDTFTFGRYEQDNIKTTRPEPIEWQVLAVENGRVLIISKYGLDQVSYNSVNADVSWETCSLRTWLNDGFINTAFNAEEQSKIAWVTNKNPSSLTSGTKIFTTEPQPDGNDTLDRVFLLSIDEVNRFFPTDEARECEPTEYAKENGVMTNWLNPPYGRCGWWLRTRVGFIMEAGNRGYCAATAHSSGITENFVWSHTAAVRPALWLDPSGTAESTKTELKRPAAVYTEPTKPAQTSASADDGRYIDNCRMKSFLKPGDHAEVVTERGLKLRKKPAGSEIGVQAFRGKDVKILDGPTCVNGYVWFEIDFLGYRGWSMEGKDGIYYLRKTNGTPTNPDPSGRRSNPRPTAVPSNSNTSGRSMNQSKLKIGDTVNIVNTSGLQMFFNPAGKAMADKQAFPGKTAKITDGPKIIDGVIWWEIDFLGYRGWVTEFVPPKTYYLEKK